MSVAQSWLLLMLVVVGSSIIAAILYLICEHFAEKRWWKKHYMKNREMTVHLPGKCIRENYFKDNQSKPIFD